MGKHWWEGYPWRTIQTNLREIDMEDMDSDRYVQDLKDFNATIVMINTGGIIIGLCTFLIIGFFHPIVVKAEYYWGTKCWWIFLLLGIIGIAGSVMTDNILISTLLGVFSFSSFWTIKELFEQRERVLKGWFPMNPKRKEEYKTDPEK